ncbi:MAG: TetR/AcrR family transcriptional regulator [Bifidobacterium sp.]|nr:TetR/AcrR family transcriptional regulator [Bifidobacterium sp.]
MPRPRHDSEVLPAKERLENSFWTLLQDQDFAKITVTEIVHDAEVNRNSFYYHFSGLSELADSAIMHEVERMPAMGLLSLDHEPEVAWRRYAGQLLNDPEQRMRLDRLALLTGEHGAPELTDSLHDFMELNLMSLLGLDPEHLPAKTRMMLDFLVGGMLSVLHEWPELSLTLSAEDFMSEDIGVLTIGLCLALANGDASPYWHRVFGTAPDAPTYARRAPQPVVI